MRLGSRQRELIWEIFTRLQAVLAERKLLTWAGVFGRLTDEASVAAFDHVVVDEAQDIGIPELRFVQKLVGERPDALFFAGDLGQRIFQQPFSWKSLGVDIRGRSHTLKVCYRTSQQIRASLDRLLPVSITDVDGNADSRAATISIFAGPPPELGTFDDEIREIDAVADWLRQRVADGIAAHEIGIFVRDIKELKRARKAAATAGIAHVQLDDRIETEAGRIAIGTMHLAKGLEFRAVVVMACDDEVLPAQIRIDQVSDAADLEEVYSTERHLLYVACTRAREHLWVSGVEPASEFLDDLA
jgi:superfamily I DNA/RNA helicase